MGTAEHWQRYTESYLRPVSGLILNPRRDDWDGAWTQDLGSPIFVQQVEWELKGLQDCTTIIMNFDPATKSAISLMELGLYARQSRKLRVHCPDGFWRKGNVDIVCREYGVMQFPSLDMLLERIAGEARSNALLY